MKDKSPNGIIDQISKIREAANHLIENELKSRGIEGVVSAHGMVFGYLFNQQSPVPITSLVQQSGRAKSTVTGIVKTLERHGYIFKQASQEDGRSFLIGLTEKGWSVKSDFEEISAILMKKVYGNITLEDREYVGGLLAQIEANLG